MSDPRSAEDRVEKHRLAVETNTIEINFLQTLKKLNMLGPKTLRYRNGRNLFSRIAMLRVLNTLDLSGEEWDDDYRPKNGRDA